MVQEVVWITGAGSGIGAAMARTFAEAGYAVALTGRTRAALETVASGFAEPARAAILPGDITDRDGMAEIARQVGTEFGGINILCNNAGLNIPKRHWADPDWPSWDEVVRVNVSGALNVIGAALPLMRAGGGGVMIHTSSWAGRFHSPGAGVAYGASKHALCDISASLNSEEGRHGIRSCALCPAEVATPLMERKPGYDPAKAADMIQPEDLAQTALLVARMNPKVAVHEVVLAPVRR